MVSACRKRILLEGVTSSQIKHKYQLYSLPDEVVGDVLNVLEEAMEIPDPYKHLKAGMLETLIFSKFEKLELLSEQSRFMEGLPIVEVKLLSLHVTAEIACYSQNYASMLNMVTHKLWCPRQITCSPSTPSRASSSPAMTLRNRYG
jgi:hypothetical protein